MKFYHFAKVFWDYKDSAEGGEGDAVARGGLVSEKSAASLRKLTYASDYMAQVASPTQNMHDFKGKKSEKAELLYHTGFLSTPIKCRAQGKIKIDQQIVRKYY